MTHNTSYTHINFIILQLALNHLFLQRYAMSIYNWGNREEFLTDNGVDILIYGSAFAWTAVRINFSFICNVYHVLLNKNVVYYVYYASTGEKTFTCHSFVPVQRNR